jgi:hypothetical protein
VGQTETESTLDSLRINSEFARNVRGRLHWHGSEQNIKSEKSFFSFKCEKCGNFRETSGLIPRIGLLW